MPSIWDLPQQEPQRGPAMDEARRRAVAMLGLLGAGLPSSSDLDTSALYRSGRMDAMTGGPTRGEYMDKQRDAISNVAFGLLGAIEPLWHGSPHKFKRFDLSKIGTGEGAQAYGHGAYLAESPGVATSYQQAGNYDMPSVVTRSGKLLPIPRWSADLDPDEKAIRSIADAISLARKNGTDEAVAIAKAGDNLRGAARDSFNRFRTEIVGVNEVGNLYESRLRWPDAAREAADPLGPGHFLDYDVPFSKQPDQIRELIRQKLKDAGYLRQNDNGPRQLDAAVKSWKMEHGGMAEAPMESMLGGRGGLFGNNPEEVANTLKSAGVPGIRYLDAGSRGTGQGTHNYVVFDDALIEILKRNGVPIEGLLD